MSRAERLLDLVQLLRRHRRPVSGAALARELGVSLRTLYRDINSLQGQGAAIEGEPGIGYILRPGFLLPPLMFSDDELEALVLGSRWVADRADARLGGAARNALAKIAAVLPTDLRDELDATPLLIGPGPPVIDGTIDLALLRQAIRTERKIEIHYLDVGGRRTRRVVWPFALAYFDRVRVVVAWCESRRAFRHFRADRITAIDASDVRYPRRRQALLREWRQAEGIAEA
ncbi:MAG TPA: YafY family protein [Burkholderiaceae bacterium]|nr:YafY family protein [Burkholderiaceae bacterium]